MSTWTSSARAALAAAALAGCGALGVPGTPTGPEAEPGVARARPADPPPRMLVTGPVTVAGPAGFCVDRSASGPTGSGTLAMLASCRSLGGGMLAPRPLRPAILTALVGDAPLGLPAAEAPALLAAWAATDEGRAALSRAGRAETVTIRDSAEHDGALMLQLSDAAPFAGGAVAPDYARAILDIGGRSVMLSVLAPADRPLEPAAADQLLRRFMATTRRASAAAR